MRIYLQYITLRGCSTVIRANPFRISRRPNFGCELSVPRSFLLRIRMAAIASPCPGTSLSSRTCRICPGAPSLALYPRTARTGRRSRSAALYRSSWPCSIPFVLLSPPSALQQAPCARSTERQSGSGRISTRRETEPRNDKS